MLTSILYEFGLWIYAIYVFPKMLFLYYFKNKYRQSFFKRFGWGFPLISKGNRPLIWIHAVSMGETKAVVGLVKILKQKMRNPIIVISSITETAHAEAKKSLGFADYLVYLPFDLRFIIKPIVMRAKPDLVILTETDFWYNFLKASKQCGAKIVLVNGKISERSMHRFQKVSFFTEKLFAFIDLFCIQSKHYFERFKALGVPEGKMTLIGNLKFDASFPKQSPEELTAWRQKLHINKGDQVLVIGSTHDPEEKLMMPVLKKLWEDFPSLKVILVPRHPERVPAVEEIVRQAGISYGCFSSMDQMQEPIKLIIVDKMGILLKCYEIADAAIVAGSYTDKVGGHNILEPLGYGVPTIFGPCMHSQPEMVELVKEFGAGLQILPGDLAKQLKELFLDAELKKRLGANGQRLLDTVHGATERTWQAIKPLVRSEN